MKARHTATGSASQKQAQPGATRSVVAVRAVPPPKGSTHSRFSFAETPIWVQPKLDVGSVDDPLEHEADRVADQVMRTHGRSPGLESAGEGPRRDCACQDGEPELLQAKASGMPSGQAPASVHGALSSPGRPLDPATRSFFEPRFGRDFSDVRIHTDGAAGESARSISALGYTVGNDVVFAHGQYSPHSASGRRLLAHELAHVVQQSTNPGVIRRRVPDKRWHPGFITAGITVIDEQGNWQCAAGATATGSYVASGNFTGRPGGESDTRLGNYASVCLSPCVGRPLNLRPEFSVDASTWGKRPQPFDPPRLSVNIVFYPDSGDPDVLMKETGTGEYQDAGWPLKTNFGDLTFYTPESPGQLMVSAALADPTSGEVAIYSESIPVINCPLVATDPEPVTEEPEKPANGRQTRFNIEVPDPDRAPMVYELVGRNTPLEGPGGFFPVWQDPAGDYYYLNNGRRVDLPNFSP